ncbi:hypothetical protein ACF07D_07465 [Leucobacter sp. NPDC015123]|uniref:hypothetical protein n=1 Tax=Leucobacter sp. NPDC015123 TaxID=3364129 RepID=UPI0036F46317
MVDFETPYAMDGTLIPGAGLRRQLQQSAGPGSGVLRPGDFRITQMNVPGQGVKITAGDDLVQCRAPGRDRETYGVPLLTDQVYMGDGGDGIPGTGSSSGRRDMIIHEILDPSLPRHFTPREAWPENQYSKLSVVTGVPASAKTVADVPALNDVTCYELAAINWPASTGTITNAMIEDLREVQSPRRSELTFARPRVAADDGPQNFLTKRTSDGGEYFPGGGGYANQFEAFIPPWATRMILEPHWMSVRYVGGKNVQGRYWMEFGTEYRAGTWPGKRQYEFATQQFQFDSAGGGGTYRTNWPLMDNVQVPAKLRGKNVTFVFKAGLGNEKPTPSFPGDGVNMDALSGLGCKLTFVETALTWEDAI